MTMVLTTPISPAAPAPSKFLTQFREAAGRHGHTAATAAEMAHWCRQFILFHSKQHPQEMGRTEVGAYLEHVAKTDKDPLRAIAAARAALEFLYATFLQRELGELPWPRPPRLLDQVMQTMRVPLDLLNDVNADELQAVLAANGSR